MSETSETNNGAAALRENAFGLVWNTSKEDLGAFWPRFQEHAFPPLQTLSAQGRVKAVMPFQHKPVRLEEATDNEAWSVCVLVILSGAEDARRCAIDFLEDSAAQAFFSAFRPDAVELMRLQQNLDMFYPKNNALRSEPRLLQWLEYVFSDHQYREEYYNTQYVFSGPAMRQMWLKNWAGRFLGFEITERIRHSGRLPEWDIIHISGFTPLQMANFFMFSRKEWDRQAKACWGDSASGAEVMGRWEKQRVKIMPRAKQIMKSTIQSADLVDR